MTAASAGFPGHLGDHLILPGDSGSGSYHYCSRLTASRTCRPGSAATSAGSGSNACCSDLRRRCNARVDRPGDVVRLAHRADRGATAALEDGHRHVHRHIFAGVSAVKDLGCATVPALEFAQQASQDLASAVLDSGLSLDEFEQDLLRRAVERADGNLAAAARMLGMTRPQLHYRLKKQAD